LTKQIETVVVGGGQAGLATSYYLKHSGQEHIVLEQAEEPANAWRNGRWDSFTLVTPNWSVRMPGAEYQGDQPHGFMGRDEVVEYFEAYIEQFKLPVRFQTRVNEVKARANGDGKKFILETNSESLEASNVVVATGMYQRPKLPDFSSTIPIHIDQIHSSQYRNPSALSPGAVLVVGTGQSGAQIAEELYKSGRKVYLCVGSAGRGPRRYRGMDIYRWLTKLPEKTVDEIPNPGARYAGSIHVSGANGGQSLNLHQFSRDGVILLGRLQGVNGDVLSLKSDLKENLARIDNVERELTESVDEFIKKAGIVAPEQELPELQDGFQVEELSMLDVNLAGITTIIWATGYSFDFNLVKLPIFDDDGYPVQRRGVTEYPGVYFVGLPWLYKQKSGLLLGVGEDAEYIASVITGC
jgi:putative flavoprotein involved in K+ transport